MVLSSGGQESAGLYAMDWAKPEYSRTSVDRAGRLVTRMDRPGQGSEPIPYESIWEDIQHYAEAATIVNNWRSSHNYPLNTFKVTLRRKAATVDPDCLVAQRIKRMSSIVAKLDRFPKMNLSQMQDIGGCRAIVGSTEQVRSLQVLYEKSGLKHVLDDVDDYISEPKPSGYRGVHLIYKYNSDQVEFYNKLYIEIQMRSRLQHAWATAVETVGTMLKQALKSSQGDEDWQRFFALVSSAMALREQGSPGVPGTPTRGTELLSELRHSAQSLQVVTRLEMYRTAIDVVASQTPDQHYFLLRLEPSKGEMNVIGFPRRRLEEASNLYASTEKELKGTPGSEAVLVSVDSLAALQRAFPNYFLDTTTFLDALAGIIG